MNFHPLITSTKKQLAKSVSLQQQRFVKEQAGDQISIKAVQVAQTLIAYI